MAGRNVFTVLQQSTQANGDAAALHQPVGGKGQSQYRSYSWKEWLETSSDIACGLNSLGFQKGEIAFVLSETRAEFYLVDLGIMGAGGVSAALYTAYPMADSAVSIRKSQPNFLFLEDEKTLQSLVAEMAKIAAPIPRHVILMTGSAPATLSLADLCRMGQQAAAAEPGLLDRLQSEVSPGDPAILYLTSGATGEPKMSLASHSALLANMDMGPKVLPLRPQDSTVVFLPSAHIVQRIVMELVTMRMGTPVWFSESLARMPTELRTIRPTVFVAPPRVWERVYASTQTEIKKKSPAIQKLFANALALGRKSWEYREAGKRVPLHLKLPLAVADRVLFSKVRERLGGRIRIAASGAAPLGRDLAEFFRAVGLPLVEGYGLTEAGVLCFNPIERPKAGSVGHLLPGVEARLAEDGELFVKTPCLFAGYYGDEESTRAVMTDDGWFGTGDIAEVDQDGYWYITGRKKELIVSSNGKKIYPARIENLFKMEPFINQVLLLGDKKPYVTALFTLNANQLDGQQPEAEPVTKAVGEAVSRVNRQLADFERIRRFKVVDRDFSIEHGELTPTMKIRRARVVENHKQLVTELYLGREDSP